MPRIFLTHTPDVLENYYGPRALAALEEIAEVRINPTGAALEAAGLLDQARGCEIVISDRKTPGPAAFFEGAADCIAFLRCAVAIRNVDVEAASRAGILVTRATPGFAASVSELALGMMIDLARGISRSVAAYRDDRSPPVAMGRELRGRTLGIIGYGKIGQRLATLAQAVGMTILVSDPHRIADAPGVRQVPLATLLADSDFVVCLAAATPETEGLMDAAAFARMRTDAFFLNLSRGELVDEAALADALERGGIAGAALDVGRAPDQMPSPTLARRPDVVATPHVGGLTRPATEHQAFDTVDQVRAILQGKLPPHAVNAEHADRLHARR